jgi:16S rRNA (guanine(966)-N(2))-methyltransferase RsmD
MRVISGSAKGIKLLSVPGKTTRPITDQVKEALFNIIGVDVEGKFFLDLFGGTGAVGIEALSRGAEHAVFLEINYHAVKVIQKNLETTQLAPYATVYKKDAFVYLAGIHQPKPLSMCISLHPNTNRYGKKPCKPSMKTQIGSGQVRQPSCKFTPRSSMRV